MNLTLYMCLMYSIRYLGCAPKSDSAVATLGASHPPAQNPDSNSVAGLPEMDVGLLHVVIEWQSSCVLGTCQEHAPGVCALQGCSFLVCLPEEELVYGSRYTETRTLTAIVKQVHLCAALRDTACEFTLKGSELREKGTNSEVIVDTNVLNVAYIPIDAF